jgi:hypothetical protein
VQKKKRRVNSLRNGAACTILFISFLLFQDIIIYFIWSAGVKHETSIEFYCSASSRLLSSVELCVRDCKRA